MNIQFCFQYRNIIEGRTHQMLPSIYSTRKYNQLPLLPISSRRKKPLGLNQSISVTLNNSNGHIAESISLAKIKSTKALTTSSSRKHKENNQKCLKKVAAKLKWMVNQYESTAFRADCEENKCDLPAIYYKKFQTNFKPAHRYKTVMLLFKDCLLLYGGLGCEKSLTWAKLHLETMSWELPKIEPENRPVYSYIPQHPVYGHSMVKYKDKAIIFGGICIDEINELSIINTKTMEIVQGTRAPYRRKDHVAAACGDFMVVHGGTEVRETKSDVLIYHINLDKWSVVSGNYPALFCHGMTEIYRKGKNELYMFGGKNQKGTPQNKMYRLKVYSQSDIKCEQIHCLNPPQPRFSFSFETLSNNLLVLYGGRQSNQTTNKSLSLQNGVYNDIQVYSIEKKAWKILEIKLQMNHCFGMASTCMGNSLFIFGGSNHERYADATIYSLWVGNQNKTPWESISSHESEWGSSKKISHKHIY